MTRGCYKHRIQRVIERGVHADHRKVIDHLIRDDLHTRQVTTGRPLDWTLTRINHDRPPMPCRLDARQNIRSLLARASHRRFKQIHFTHTRKRQLLDTRASPDETFNELVGRPSQDRLRRVIPNQLGAHIEHSDPVTQLHRFLEIVGHDHDSLAQLLMDRKQLILQPLARNRIHRTERLIHQQHRRISRQRASHTHTLLLTTRKLLRITLPIHLRIQRNQLKQLINTFADALLIPAEHLRNQSDVLLNRHVWKQAASLDHITDLAAQLITVHPGDVLLVDEDLALRRLDQPVHHLQRRGLTATRRAHQRNNRAGGDLHRQTTDRRGRGPRIPLGHILQIDPGTMTRRLSPLRTRLERVSRLGCNRIIRHGYPSG